MENMVMDNPTIAKGTDGVEEPMDVCAAASAVELEDNRLIQNILLLTLDPRNLGPNGPRSAVHLGASTNESLLNLDGLENLFFARILMPAEELPVCVVNNPSGNWINLYGKPDQSDVVSYLGECFIRLQHARQADTKPSSARIFDALEEFIKRHFLLGFEEPELLRSANISYDLAAFYWKEMDSHELQITSLIHNLFGHSSSSLLRDVAFAVLEVARTKAQSFGLMRMQDFDAVVHMVTTFSSNPGTAKLLMDFSSPRNNRDAAGFEQTLIGTLLKLSCLPEHNDVPPEFFQSSMVGGIQPAEIATTEKFVWSNTNRVVEAAFVIFNNVVRQSSELREQVLRWIGDCLSANFGRAKMWQQDVHFQIRLASDGFILNLSAVLLRLCRPFIRPTKNLRILKIHPLWPHSGIYLRKMPEETTLMPKPENLPSVQMPSEFNFLSSCFFLCHESLRLGWQVLWDRFGKFNRALNEIEDRLNQARESGNAEEQQLIEQSIQRVASRHLSMKAALTLPENMELMIEFSVCTATWLTQMSVQSPSTMPTQVPAEYIPLFPHTPQPPLHLAFIPELLVENVLEILTCNARLPATTGQTTDWQYEWMVELMNLALLFMPSSGRIYNPHLRAKLALLMHNLMPYNRHADTYKESRHAALFALLDSHKERLFREHEYKREFFPTVLDIFVSIEMAGNTTLRFGEAFHYRRPLYAIMEYLFTFEYHRQRVEDLASDSLASLNDASAPLFLKFLNHLVNDSTYMLEGALEYLAKIKKMEAEQPAWQDLPEEQRKEKEGEFKQNGDTARYHNILGRETIQCLKSLTTLTNPARIMLSNVMVDRLAVMLNNFLQNLVSPEKRTQYKVKDFEQYSFSPKELVTKIGEIYVDLGSHDARKEFFLAICQDKRSYNPQLFKQATEVLGLIGAHGRLIHGVQLLAKNVEMTQATVDEEEEFSEDMPSEYRDALMDTLMRDPVKLPSSGQVLDRSTIARILLTDQMDPFNRQPLTMAQVVPLDDLRNEIENWLSQRRAQKAQK